MSGEFLQLIWGCNPGRQLEVAWLRRLMGWMPVHQWQASDLTAQDLQPGRPTLLVESGLLRLERSPSPGDLAALRLERNQRLALVAASGPFTLVHLSDEEGLDGDELYPMLPPGVQIWRNFPYPRFRGVTNFPIGPRSEFFHQQELISASARPFPWAFMGTIWGGGSRLIATSLFLRSLPQGFYFGGRHFGLGVPVDRYKTILGQSVFALCPEGDRHLDTFRLYESLQMGCLPLVVDQADQAPSLLGEDYPLPVFASWSEALGFAQHHLKQPERLDSLQRKVVGWWQSRAQGLSEALRVCCLGR